MGNRKTKGAILLTGVGAIAAVLLGAIMPVLVAGANNLIAQGYLTNDSGITEGMAVSLTAPDTQFVERTVPDNQDQFIGVVTAAETGPLPASSSEPRPDNQETVYVLTSGEASAFASDFNGQIKKGDYLVASPLEGVLMKAPPQATAILGVAETDFSPDQAQTSSITDHEGSSRTILIGEMKIIITHGVVAEGEGASFLVLFGRSLTGKSVTAVQVLIAAIIFLLLITVEGAIIYAAVRNSITAVGRNPLASSALRKQLLQISWLALLVLLFGAAAIYIVLWA